MNLRLYQNFVTWRLHLSCSNRLVLFAFVPHFAFPSKEQTALSNTPKSFSAVNIFATLYENVWSLNGINIFCWLHTSVYYSIFFVWLLLLVVFGYFVCGLRHFCFCSSFHLFSFFNQSIEHFTRNHLWIVHTTCLKRFSFCTQFAFQFNTVIEREIGSRNGERAHAAKDVGAD